MSELSFLSAKAPKPPEEKGKTIEEVAREAAPKIAVLGLGGAGGNVVTWMMDKKTVGVKILALDTSAQDLVTTRADKKILLGYEVNKGLGCGGFPELGAEATRKNLTDVKRVIKGIGLIFVVAGLGGGTGTGGAPVIAKAAKEMGALTIGVVTLPFSVERARWARAGVGLEHLRDATDAVVVIDNSKLREVAGNQPLKHAFSFANELVATFVKNMVETIALPSLVNLDFADLRSVMTAGGICAIGVGEGEGDNKIDVAVERAFATQLLEVVDVSKAGGALVHVEGGDDMTLDEVNRAAELVISKTSPDIRVVWGARVNSAMTGSVRVSIVLSGVRSPVVEAFEKEGREVLPESERARIKGAIVLSEE